MIFSRDGWPYLLVPMIPLAVILELIHAGPALIFFVSALGVIPTAALMGRATEELADRAGPGIGGLLNVTFGNFPELLIAFFALIEGLQEVVKASIIGSILGNVLLVMGAAMLVGGLGRDRQRFEHRAASAQGTMLILAAAALAMPAVFQLVSGGGLPGVGESRTSSSRPLSRSLSLAVAIVLLFSYAAGLWFSLRPTATCSTRQSEDDEREEGDEPWSVRTLGPLLAGRGPRRRPDVRDPRRLDRRDRRARRPQRVLHRRDHRRGRRQRRRALGGRLRRRRRTRWTSPSNIAIGSSAQVALFVAPVLVLLSFVFGPGPLSLVFNGYELAAVFLAVIIATHIARDGESTWFEGLQLLAVYAVLGPDVLLRLTTSLHAPLVACANGDRARLPPVRFCVNVSILFTEVPLLERFEAARAGRLRRGRAVVARGRGPVGGRGRGRRRRRRPSCC